MNQMTYSMAQRIEPIAAQLAEGPVGLLRFAQLAGRNMLEVIPIETVRQTYMRGPLNIHYICDPEIVTELLVGEGRAFPKAKFTKDIIGSAVGNGLILSEGEKWRQQRHRYSPLFAARNLPRLSAYFAETGIEIGRSLADNPGPVDFVQVAPAATLANISRVMFSGTVDVTSEQIRRGLLTYFEYISKISLFDVMGLPKWLPRKKWLRSMAPVTTMRDLARHVIEARRAEKRPEPLDFLDLLIEAVDNDFEDLETTVDNLLTFVVAGHETSANAIAWGFYLLSLDPDTQERIRQEVLSVRPEGPIGFDDVQAMPLLHSHVQETLRLYPSAAFFARDADKDVEVKGIHFKTGDALFFPVYSLHRNEVLWDAPAQYRPERFLDVAPPRGQYIPFGDGPRICIGAQYALTEIKILMASVLREVRIAPSSVPVPRPVLTFTMRPGGPLVLDVAPV
ncbi:cytochrome P450 [Roseibacterium sp. SDUM158016]|uniref:cytochrome P450 n=1 Tax=Roseicyclus sediminis TaxID=2980997 RepID=UPI0021D24C8D|nr:cytochrome P450 [Roseibacterium sp. SDUM158016]MCU4652002.1 cytochrome P450 [Roseibacterium sp. SDUM158016]